MTSVDLMGLNDPMVNGLNQLYGAIDNGMIAGDSTNWGMKKEVLSDKDVDVTKK